MKLKWRFCTKMANEINCVFLLLLEIGVQLSIWIKHVIITIINISDFLSSVAEKVKMNGGEIMDKFIMPIQFEQWNKMRQKHSRHFSVVAFCLIRFVKQTKNYFWAFKASMSNDICWPNEKTTFSTIFRWIIAFVIFKRKSFFISNDYFG